ncbi:endonuclease domain-containing protein [Acinetobacter modestus]|uniref:endonuclease domain-containing protein n=1 Tax=Acinetobacter modestus TaxID=1776740 RepID=UPI0020308DAC|nr:endonuclease domain-containing protein [Acinetobacter modestus]MCM1958470.1 endonuclease domain-containing protein [Acinetobacter modestus]
MQPYNKNLKQPSRDLRKNMTDAEQLLWQRIRRKQILGLQFYRQKPILNFIVDFYCPKANLVIECDGGQHYTEEGLEADRVRDQALGQLGLNVLRFDNRQVLTEIDAVVERIYCVVEQRLELIKLESPLNPPLRKGSFP